MKITPVKALTDNYIWMIQEGNHAVCVDPSDPTPVLEFLVRNRLMLAQTWVTHPHPDHEGGAAALWRGYMESPVYGETDIEAATHTVTAGTQFTFGEGLITVWQPRAIPTATSATSWKLQTAYTSFAAIPFFPQAADACSPVRSNSFTTASNGSTNYPKAPCSTRHTNTPPPT